MLSIFFVVISVLATNIYPLFFKELKLNVLHSDDLRELSQLLSRVTMLLGWDVYADHYKRDFPHLFHLTEKPTSFPSAVDTRKENITDSEITLPSAPPHIFKWLLLKLQGMQVSIASSLMLVM